MGVAALVIVEEMADWTAAGGGNSGICGDPNHTYGFHLGANQVGPDDYSRWRDPNGADGPYVDWNYCCAGDFSHRGDPTLRAMHAAVLRRLLAGEMPMVCEFIGQPYPDQPVLYWARWDGRLLRYTGAGHDTWSHISWYRSMANQRAYLWSDDMSWQEQIPAAEILDDGRTVPHPTQPTLPAGVMLSSTNAAAWEALDRLDRLDQALTSLAAQVQALADQIAATPPGGLTYEQTVQAAREGAEIASDS